MELSDVGFAFVTSLSVSLLLVTVCAACAADDDRPTFVTLTLSLCDLDLVSLCVSRAWFQR